MKPHKFIFLFLSMIAILAASLAVIVASLMVNHVWWLVGGSLGLYWCYCMAELLEGAKC